MQLSFEGDELRARLKRAGLKLTPQRQAVWDELSGRRDHPTALEIYAAVRNRLPGISPDTVYRTLLSLERAGLCRALDGLGAARRFDPARAEHHHFHCTVCGRVFDFMYPAFDRLPPPALPDGFTIAFMTARLEGRCPRCGRANKEKHPRKEKNDGCHQGQSGSRIRRRINGQK